MKGWKKKTAASPAMRVAAVATESGLPSAGPAGTKAMPHFTRVFESAAITMASQRAGSSRWVSAGSVAGLLDAWEVIVPQL